MQLNKINGNSYFIYNPTNIGIYAFKNKYCIMVDTGISNTAAAKLCDILESGGLKPKYVINTHHHPDHAGGNHYIREHYAGCAFLAGGDEKIFIENDMLFPQMLYSANPVKELIKGNAKAKSVPIDLVLENGVNKINDEKFEIICLPGHSIGHIGIGTPDRVCFLGDSIFSEKIMKKHPLPFLFDIDKQLNTLQIIKGLEYEYYVLGHADSVYDLQSIRSLADENIKYIEKNIDDILELLSQPLTCDDLLEQLCIINNIQLDFRNYYLCHSSAGAFLSYLYNKDMLEYQIEEGKLYYYAKQ